MIKSKNVVKKLTTILFTLVAVFTIGLTNVNATKTAEVANLDSLESAMNDNVTDVVKLTSDITLRENIDTTFSLKISKTLDFNGFTLTIPQQYKLKLIYYNTLDLKFINSSSRKTAKLNLLTDTGYTPIYNEIKKAEYTVNFEMDGIDVEYIKDFYSFWQTAGDYRFNNVVFKNLKVTGFYEMVDTRAYKTIKFSNVTKESKNANSNTYLLYSSSLTVDEVIDADSIIEYSDREGTKIANRTATLGTIDAYFGPITVKKKEVQTLDATTEDELIAAVNQINNSKDTIIKLGADIKLTKFLGFNVLGNVTLDLAGNTLDVTKNNLTFYYGYKDENNYNFRSNLTIKDSGNGNNGKIIEESSFFHPVPTQLIYLFLTFNQLFYLTDLHQLIQIIDLSTQTEIARSRRTQCFTDTGVANNQRSDFELILTGCKCNQNIVDCEIEAKPVGNEPILTLHCISIIQSGQTILWQRIHLLGWLIEIVGDKRRKVRRKYTVRYLVTVLQHSYKTRQFVY